MSRAACRRQAASHNGTQDNPPPSGGRLPEKQETGDMKTVSCHLELNRGFASPAVQATQHNNQPHHHRHYHRTCSSHCNTITGETGKNAEPSSLSSTVHVTLRSGALASQPTPVVGGFNSRSRTFCHAVTLGSFGTAPRPMVELSTNPKIQMDKSCPYTESPHLEVALESSGQRYFNSPDRNCYKLSPVKPTRFLQNAISPSILQSKV